MSSVPPYVLITPARNEVQFIELTLKSVVAQTALPRKWVIVSDGSTDGTDAIVARYAAEYSWIELLRIPERRDRSFGGKARAVNAAYTYLHNLDFRAVVNLDADISVGPDHFAYLLSQLSLDPALGIVGAPFREYSGETYDYRYVSIEHVSGACQVFRRECFEDIGGYTPLAAGGVDHVAVISARMKGWKTRTFTEVVCVHHRQIGTAEHGPCAASFRTGIKDYAIGGHPLWEIARVAFRITQRPFIVGGMALGAGYFWAMIRRVKRPVRPEVQAFHRQEQMRRIKNVLLRKPKPRAERIQHSA